VLVEDLLDESDLSELNQ